ncbi:MAG TPA: LamG domain-containing protein, partial [Candidatus Dormibacteraeota bacterium]|nr:LamG domain-containing protein [Candidatus Dormibacteraeota bacterium]
IANPATNYISLASTIQAVASGQNLFYQWFKAPSTLLPGQTSDTLLLPALQTSDGGSYFVQVTNSAGSSNSPSVALMVLPIPTNAANLNLTNGLVVHLPFDSDFADISGRSNDGTNRGAGLVTGGAIGPKALHYETGINPGVTNYVTLGVRPDLQFSSNVDFTVSFWVRQPSGSTYTNLPFFTDAIGSTGNGGFAFAPYAGTGGGGWSLTIGTVSSPNAATHFPDVNLINDGNWHHLVHVASRTANATTYLDGTQVDSQSIVVAGNINTANAAVVGQDPTGLYPVVAQADLDDLGVWRRTLSQLEISGMYLAGVSNSVSFAPVVASPIVQASLNIQKVAGQWQITWTGTGGVLQAAPTVTGSYTNVPGATSPYTVPTSSSPQLFYRLKY